VESVHGAGKMDHTQQQRKDRQELPTTTAHSR
jgi:hypothetical protein